VSKNVAAIICAAGPGTRFGGKRKKQFTDVAGRAVFVRSVELFANRDDVKQILLGIAEERSSTSRRSSAAGSDSRPSRTPSSFSRITSTSWRFTTRADAA